MSGSERPLAEQLAHEVLRDPATHGWLAPLARDYLKLAEAHAKVWEGIDAHGRDTATGVLVPSRILQLVKPDG